MDSIGFVKYQYKILGIRLKFIIINKNFDQEDYLLEKITNNSFREKSSSDGETLSIFLKKIEFAPSADDRKCTGDQTVLGIF